MLYFVFIVADFVVKFFTDIKEGFKNAVDYFSW